jgi:hypothetical protein
MKTAIFMFVVIAASMASIPAVYAAPPANPNGFGKAASQDLAQDGEMGAHSRAGGAAGSPPFDSDGKPGRLGIGNVRDAFGLDHVSEIPATLCALPGQQNNPACS